MLTVQRPLREESLPTERCSWQLYWRMHDAEDGYFANTAPTRTKYTQLQFIVKKLYTDLISNAIIYSMLHGAESFLRIWQVLS